MKESDTVRLAYMLNNPMTAVKATGGCSVLPENYSMVSVNKENVIIETVKEAEASEDTILRLYESKNIRSKAEIALGIPAKTCHLCDMLENELEELPIVDGKVKVNLGGFEIITLKLKN